MNRNGTTTVIAVSTAMVLVTLGIYWQVHEYKFCFDDAVYITTNEHVNTGLNWENVRWALTSLCGANWHPLASLSHILDCEFFGLNPRWHHMVGLLFHLANTVLLFLVLKWMTGKLWPSAFVAAVFGLHPLHVESVAWIAERKDVLSTFFWLLTIWAYARYTERQRFGGYVLVMLFFCLGLLSKPMLVTLPFVLLLLDYWPLDRLQLGWGAETGRAKPGGNANVHNQGRMVIRLVAEKVPLLVLSAISCVVTYKVQQIGGAVSSFLPLNVRVANAVVSYGRYIVKMFWPSNLAVYYPHPGVIETGPLVSYTVLLVCVSGLVILWWRRRPWLLTGWFWYLGTLVPVIGLVQVGRQAMADRYTYIPLIGLFIIIAWGMGELTARWRIVKISLGACAGIVLAALTICTWFQTGYWRNNITLYEHALEVAAPSAFMHNNLGIELAAQGKIDEAIKNYEAALQLNPSFYKAYYNLGTTLVQKGKIEKAVKHFKAAVRLKPASPLVHYNLGVLLSHKGEIADAINHWTETVRLKPDWTEAHNNLAWVLATSKDENLRNPAEAVRLAERACELTNFKRADMLDTLSVAYAAAGRFVEAIETAEKALELAEAAKKEKLATDIRGHLELYKNSKPYLP